MSLVFKNDLENVAVALFVVSNEESLPCGKFSKAAYLGSSTRIFVPFPTADATSIEPPWSLTILWTIDKPRPVPDAAIENGSKRCFEIIRRKTRARYPEIPSGHVPRLSRLPAPVYRHRPALH